MNGKPIFIQLIEMIEDGIIAENYVSGDLVISSTQICQLYKVNPATAIKALSSLADDGVLEKDRGIGMRVTAQAFNIVSKKRKQNFMDKMLDGLIDEAIKLGLEKTELLALIEQKFSKKGEKNDRINQCN